MMMYWVKRIWFPAWFLLLGCGGVDRSACYAEADAWHVQQQEKCKRTEGAWSTCSRHEAVNQEHLRRQAQCP